MVYLALLFVKSGQDLPDRVNLSSLLHCEHMKPQNIDLTQNSRGKQTALLKQETLFLHHQNRNILLPSYKLSFDVLQSNVISPPWKVAAAEKYHNAAITNRFGIPNRLSSPITNLLIYVFSLLLNRSWPLINHLFTSCFLNTAGQSSKQPVARKVLRLCEE